MVQVLILSVRKCNGEYIEAVIQYSDGSTGVFTVSKLYNLVKSGRVRIQNAYISTFVNKQNVKQLIVRHKHNEALFKVETVSIDNIKQSSLSKQPVKQSRSSTGKAKQSKSVVKLDLEKHRNSKLYNGNTYKFGVTIKGVDYIAKFAKTKSDISTLCEHVASSFINNLGYQAHKTILCLYKGEVVVLMKDFTAEGYFLRSFKDTGQSSEDTDVTAKSYTYEDVLYLIDKHTKINSLDKEKVKLHFWRMFVLDAILANRDRHHGNWGYLSKQSGYVLAPIYDNGACLFPDVSSRIEEYKKDRAGFLRERAERFPASLLLKYSESEHRNKRTNYNEVIGSMQNRELQIVLKEFRALSFDKIKSAIVAAVSSDLIKPIYKQFFIDIVLVRYLHIVCRLSMEESISRVIGGSLC